MPMKPKRPCRYPGCPGLCENGQVYCPKHIQWSGDRLRGGADARGYGERTPSKDVIDAFTGSDGAVRPQPILISFNRAYAPRPISPSYPFQIIGRVL